MPVTAAGLNNSPVPHAFRFVFGKAPSGRWLAEANGPRNMSPFGVFAMRGRMQPLAAMDRFARSASRGAWAATAARWRRRWTSAGAGIAREAIRGLAPAARCGDRDG